MRLVTAAPASKISKPAAAKLEVGTRVLGDYGEAGAYYFGRVSKVTSKSVYITYDDGDTDFYPHGSKFVIPIATNVKKNTGSLTRKGALVFAEKHPPTKGSSGTKAPATKDDSTPSKAAKKKKLTAAPLAIRTLVYLLAYISSKKTLGSVVGEDHYAQTFVDATKEYPSMLYVGKARRLTKLPAQKMVRLLGTGSTTLATLSTYSFTHDLTHDSDFFSSFVNNNFNNIVVSGPKIAGLDMYKALRSQSFWAQFYKSWVDEIWTPNKEFRDYCIQVSGSSGKGSLDIQKPDSVSAAGLNKWDCDEMLAYYKTGGTTVPKYSTMLNAVRSLALVYPETSKLRYDFMEEEAEILAPPIITIRLKDLKDDFKAMGEPNVSLEKKAAATISASPKLLTPFISLCNSALGDKGLTDAQIKAFVAGASGSTGKKNEILSNSYLGRVSFSSYFKVSGAEIEHRISLTRTGVSDASIEITPTKAASKAAGHHELFLKKAPKVAAYVKTFGKKHVVRVSGDW